jgi:hypothetical protein
MPLERCREHVDHFLHLDPDFEKRGAKVLRRCSA